MGNLLNDIPSLDGVQPDWTTVTLVTNSAQQPNLQQLIATTAISAEPRLSTVSANLQQAIGVASTTVAAGSATPAQAAATLAEDHAKSQSSRMKPAQPTSKAENVTAPTQDLSVLYIGGTGTISASCVRRSVAAGMSVYVLNRGQNVKHRVAAGHGDLAAGRHRRCRRRCARPSATWSSARSRTSCPTTRRTRREAVSMFRGRTRQYLHISTASLYRKPVLQWPIVESNLRQNPFVSYSRDKIAAEDELMRACVHDAGSR